MPPPTPYALRLRVTLVSDSHHRRLFSDACCLCFWKALGQSAQAEQDTPILCSRHEPVTRGRGVPEMPPCPLPLKQTANNNRPMSAWLFHRQLTSHRAQNPIKVMCQWRQNDGAGAWCGRWSNRRTHAHNSTPPAACDRNALSAL